MGLRYAERVAARDCGEVMVDAERLEEELRQPFALVGANRELGARLLNPSSAATAPGKGRLSAAILAS